MTYFELCCCLLSVIRQVNDCLPILTAMNMNNCKPHTGMNIFTVKAVISGYNSSYFHFHYVNNQSNVVMFKSYSLFFSLHFLNETYIKFAAFVNFGISFVPFFILLVSRHV